MSESGRQRLLGSGGHASIAATMDMITTILPYAQIILSILLVASILLQQRGASIGGAFGGDNFSSTFYKRRGAEKVLFQVTIVLGILFVLSAVLSLILS